MKTLPLNVKILMTSDGSPSLLWPGLQGTSEGMHHSSGALSESFYIYQTALLKAQTFAAPIHVLSLGLGLAYNELMTVGQMHLLPDRPWQLWSFESELSLRQAFLRWLGDDPSGDPLVPVLAQVNAQVAGRLGLDPFLLQNLTKQAVDMGQIELRGSFPENVMPLSNITCVYYDAFSNKMNPELWVEAQLQESLNNILAKQCVFASYAATGSLGRALKKMGFVLTPRAGFMGKRESTLAFKGVNLNREVLENLSERSL